MSVTQPFSGGPRARILVADDEPDVCALLEEFLKARGYEVTLAYDGEEALAKVREQPPDLLLLDMRMPKRDGVGVMKELRTIAPDLPVVLVTGIGDMELTREALRLGATGYVPKPINFDYLEMSIGLNIPGKSG
ncbi:MAG: response regulator [Nitrospinota bacterium]